MDQDSDKHPNPSHIGGLTQEDDRMLRQAKENLLQAQEALCLAQKAYDVLASQRPQKIIPSRRKLLQNRRRLTDKDANAQRQEIEPSAAKRRLKVQEKARGRAFFNGFQADVQIETPIEELPALFQQVKSLDKFARKLGITRRNAIYALKMAGLDVVEAIAKDWENGAPLRTLSEDHGPMPQTISNWIKSTGRAIKPRNSNEKYDRTRMYELFDGGETTNQIAKTMKLSWATVQKCKGNWWHAKTQHT